MIDLSAALSPTQLRASLERDMQNPEYIASIEASRKQMLAGETRDWREVLKPE